MFQPGETIDTQIYIDDIWFLFVNDVWIGKSGFGMVPNAYFPQNCSICRRSPYTISVLWKLGQHSSSHTMVKEINDLLALIDQVRYLAHINRSVYNLKLLFRVKEG